MALSAAYLGNALAQPDKSAMDYQNEYEMRDLLRAQRQGQLQQNALALQTQRANFDERQRLLGEQAGIRGAITGLPQGTSRADMIGAVERLGTPTAIIQADAWRKADTERAKSEASTAKDMAEVMDKRLGQYKHALVGMTNPDQAAMWIQAQFQDPVLKDHVHRVWGSPEQAIAAIPRNTPEAFGQWMMQQSMGVEKYQEHLRNLAKDRREEGKDKREAEGAASVIANRPLIPGQNGAFVPNAQLQDFEIKKAAAGAAQVPGMTYMTDAQGNIVGLPTKAPLGKIVVANVVRDAGGAALPGKDGDMTEDQGKASGWLAQATTAHQNMMKVIDANPSAARPGAADAVAAIPGLGGVGNYMRDADRQKFMQSSSSLSEALLRAATGAGVNAQEAKQKIEELTPVWGEKDETTKQKLAAIPVYIASLQARAGKQGTKAAQQALRAGGIDGGPTASRIGQQPAFGIQMDAIDAELARRKGK